MVLLEGGGIREERGRRTGVGGGKREAEKGGGREDGGRSREQGTGWRESL